METKHIKSELLYIEEHRSCQNYMTTIETGFKYLEFAKNAVNNNPKVIHYNN